MFMQLNIIFFSLYIAYILIIFISTCFCQDEFCYDEFCDEQIKSKNFRYLLYDVNPPEGFNLRRDVYMRFAILAHKLKQSNDLSNFKLVLPPWSHLYHWSYSSKPEWIPWGLYFDLESLKSFAPVTEMHEFFSFINKSYSVEIEEVYVLQHFKDMFESGNFEEKMKLEDCERPVNIKYFHYQNVTSKNIKCLSYHGSATFLTKLLHTSKAKTILVDHGEIALHDMFGNKLYWQCRRSMRFNKELQKVVLEFRGKYLNSTNELDNTLLPDNWQDEKKHRKAVGGPYLSIHLRRKDFLRGRAHQVPSIRSISSQIIKRLNKLNLHAVFIATDASDSEFEELVGNIPSDYKILRYFPTTDIINKFKDGGIAIIEQIICSYARFFIGTYESTFSFRIQEEREILGFPTETTFNSFCKNEKDCPQPSMWKIVH